MSKNKTNLRRQKIFDFETKRTDSCAWSLRSLWYDFIISPDKAAWTLTGARIYYLSHILSWKRSRRNWMYTIKFRGLCCPNGWFFIFPKCCTRIRLQIWRQRRFVNHAVHRFQNAPRSSCQDFRRCPFSTTYYHRHNFAASDYFAALLTRINLTFNGIQWIQATVNPTVSTTLELTIHPKWSRRTIQLSATCSVKGDGLKN